jgi:hypothetical protein
MDWLIEGLSLLLFAVWTTPKTWVANATLTAAEMNTYVRDNTADLDARQYPTRLTTNTTAVGTDANTDEKTLATYNLAAGKLATNGQAVRVTVAFQFAATANTKTIRVKFGSTNVLSVAYGGVGATGGAVWADVVITRTSPTGQKAIGHATSSILGNYSATVNDSTYAAPAETLAGAVEIKVTGQNGTAAASDITHQFSMIMFVP